MGRFLMMFAALAFLAADAVADLKVDPVFSSNMVLQQEKPIAFFGTADPESTVTVEFNGKKVAAKAGKDGKWRAEFPAVKAGETAYTVRISDGKKSVTLNDVLVGGELRRGGAQRHRSADPLCVPAAGSFADRPAACPLFSGAGLGEVLA